MASSRRCLLRDWRAVGPGTAVICLCLPLSLAHRKCSVDSYERADFVFTKLMASLFPTYVEDPLRLGNHLKQPETLLKVTGLTL